MERILTMVVEPPVGGVLVDAVEVCALNQQNRNLVMEGACGETRYSHRGGRGHRSHRGARELALQESAVSLNVVKTSMLPRTHLG